MCADVALERLTTWTYSDLLWSKAHAGSTQFSVFFRPAYEVVIRFKEVPAPGSGQLTQKYYYILLVILVAVISDLSPFHMCTAILNLSLYYLEELKVRMQISESVWPDIKWTSPWESLVQSPCNVQLTPCVNENTNMRKVKKKGHLYEDTNENV